MVGCFTWILNKSLYLGQVWIYIYIYIFLDIFFSNFIGNFKIHLHIFCFCWFHGNSQIFLGFFCEKRLSFAETRPLPRGPRFVCQVFLNMEAPFFFGLFSMSFMDAAKKTTADIGAATSRAESRAKAAKTVVKRPMEISRRFCWKRSVTHGRDFYEDS